MIRNSSSVASTVALPTGASGTVVSSGGIMQRTTERLEAVPQDVLGEFAGSDRSRDLHENLLHSLPTMNAAEVAGQPCAPGPLAFPFTQSSPRSTPMAGRFPTAT